MKNIRSSIFSSNEAFTPFSGCRHFERWDSGCRQFLTGTTGRTYAASVRRLCPATDEKINIRSERHGSRLSIQRYSNHTEDATSRSTLYNNTQVDRYGVSTGDVTHESAPNIESLLPVTNRLVNNRMHRAEQIQLNKTNCRIQERITKQQHTNDNSNNISYSRKATNEWTTVTFKRGTKRDQTWNR